MAHFLEADLQPWAAALAAALFAPQPDEKLCQQSWNLLDALAPLGDAVDTVLRASELPLLEQLPRTPAEWQPAVIGSRAVAGALELSYGEAAACYDAKGATARDAWHAATAESHACTASLSTLRALRFCFHDECLPGSCVLAPLVDAAVLARPLCVLTTLTRLDVSVAIGPTGAHTFAAGLTCLSRLADLRVHALSCGATVAALAPALASLTTLTALHLTHNGMGAGGAEALALALRHLSRLAALGSVGDRSPRPSHHPHALGRL